MDELKQEIVNKAQIICDLLKKGSDVEIRRSKDGVTVAEVKKKVVAR